MTSKRILDIHADYELAAHMVVFSHGFGVDRTDRGMFSDIVAQFPDDYGYVMFDYNERNETGVYISSFEDQQRMLLTIIAWLSEQSEVIDISLVAHSMGCITAALAQPPEINKAVMVAPPVVINDKNNDYFTQLPGCTLQDGVWSIPRRDGSTTFIPEIVLAERLDINAEQSLLNYATVQPYALFIAPNDDVLGNVDYNNLALDDNITAQTIDGANHNFTGESRLPLVTAVVDWLTT